jgi:ferredoxin-thioredoxin reductase catalytic subunit
MVEYKFDLDRFRKLFGKRCPCLIPNESNPIEEQCPCVEFRNTGKCRCKLFGELK